MDGNDEAGERAGVAEAGPDVILVDNLEVQAHVGVHGFEHGQTQRLRFDIEIQTRPDYGQVVRKTSTYVSYEDAIEFIRAKASSGEHVELVEEWAEAVAAFVLQSPLVDVVTVSVTKPDIYPSAAGVGIRIRRRRAP